MAVGVLVSDVALVACVLTGSDSGVDVALGVVIVLLVVVLILIPRWVVPSSRSARHTSFKSMFRTKYESKPNRT